MKQELTPAERLIVAADFKGVSGRSEVYTKVLHLADQLAGTGVVLKVNSALRAHGYDLIDEIQARELRVFADLKLNDIPATLAGDGELLREAKPYILTAMCSTGTVALKALKDQLPGTEVLGVTILTSLTERDTGRMFGKTLSDAVMALTDQVIDADGYPCVDGFISSAKEVGQLRQYFTGRNFSYNTPGIRPAWALVESDDQNMDCVMTPSKAIKAGADRIVIGRPITQAESPADAVARTIEEIASAS